MRVQKLPAVRADRVVRSGRWLYPRCRTASYNKIAAAFDALRDEMLPRMGILTLKSHALGDKAAHAVALVADDDGGRDP